jgi:hypothetical protein
MLRDAQRRRQLLPRPATVIAGLIVMYLLAYVVISRRGYAEADQYEFEGFYYVAPETRTHGARENEHVRFSFSRLT